VVPEMPVFQAYRGATPPRFVNDAELETAKILDYYRVPWEYEPRTFVLEQDAHADLVRIEEDLADALVDLDQRAQEAFRSPKRTARRSKSRS